MTDLHVFGCGRFVPGFRQFGSTQAVQVLGHQDNAEVTEETHKAMGFRPKRKAVEPAPSLRTIDACQVGMSPHHFTFYNPSYLPSVGAVTGGRQQRSEASFVPELKQG